MVPRGGNPHQRHFRTLGDVPLFEKILRINGLGDILAVESGYEEGCKWGARKGSTDFGGLWLTDRAGEAERGCFGKGLDRGEHRGRFSGSRPVLFNNRLASGMPNCRGEFLNEGTL